MYLIKIKIIEGRKIAIWETKLQKCTKSLRLFFCNEFLKYSVIFLSIWEMLYQKKFQDILKLTAIVVWQEKQKILIMLSIVSYARGTVLIE